MWHMPWGTWRARGTKVLNGSELKVVCGTYLGSRTTSGFWYSHSMSVIESTTLRVRLGIAWCWFKHDPRWGYSLQRDILLVESTHDRMMTWLLWSSIQTCIPVLSHWAAGKHLIIIRFADSAPLITGLSCLKLEFSYRLHFVWARLAGTEIGNC